MKFVITKNILENVIASMQPFLEKKDSSAITSHVYLETKDNKLIVKATDYEIGLETTVENISNIEDGKTTVNGNNLLGIIKRLKNENITLEADSNNLIIKQNKSVFKLPTYDANEYPNINKYENLKELSISTINFINSIKKITPSIDNNNPKFELNGALLDIKSQKINFVSTDTRRLALSYLENISNDEMQLIIPKERIIPSSLKYNFPLPKNILVESIKLVTSLFSNIKITFNPKYIIFESLDEDSVATTQIRSEERRVGKESRS